MIKVYNFILNIILTNENRKKLSMNKILRRMNSKTLNKIKKNLCEVQRNQKIIFFRVKSNFLYQEPVYNYHFTFSSKYYMQNWLFGSKV